MKIALQTGASLVPVYTFGENEVVSVVDVSKVAWARHLQRAFKKIGGFTLPFVYGRGIWGLPFGLLPYQVPLTAVVGASIEVPHFTGAALLAVSAVCSFARATATIRLAQTCQ